MAQETPRPRPVQRTAGVAKARDQAQQAMTKIREYERIADERLSRVRALKDLESNTGIPKTYGLLISSLLLSLVTFDIGAPLIVNLVAFIYPAYCSLRALQTANTHDDKRWLTYWICFSLVNTIDYFRDSFRAVVPFYDVLKLAGLMWLYFPGTNGAEMVYDKVVKPAFVAVAGESKVGNGQGQEQEEESTRGFPMAEEPEQMHEQMPEQMPEPIAEEEQDDIVPPTAAPEAPAAAPADAPKTVNDDDDMGLFEQIKTAVF